jgi:DNA polymerase-3 subunit beta
VNKQATFVGTDGKKLARAYLPIEVPQEYKGSFIIPVKAVEEIFKNLGEEGEVTVYLMPDKIALETPDITLVSKLLAGDYPDITRIIPEIAETPILLHREELMSLLRQVALFANDGTQSVRFTFSNGELKLTANATQVGEGRVSMPANYQGPKLEIAFNPNFFLDILRHSKNETVTLGLADSYNPGVITDNAMSHFVTAQASPLFVLMPMRLNED